MNKQAQISWDEHGQPLSTKFGDVYFSPINGLEESRYVFLQHNQLPERFAAMQPGERLLVAETGFGTGLNFLACWQCFLQHAPAEASFEFISVEKYPMGKQELSKALALWPELAELREQLLEQYQQIKPGMQRFEFAQGRIALRLLVGEASEQLASLQETINAWFLDGFAPSKNPQMWSEQLFAQLARLSCTGSTVATFTSAGFVRRGLQAVGFNMQRPPGYAFKRQMLSGTFDSAKPDEQ